MVQDTFDLRDERPCFSTGSTKAARTVKHGTGNAGTQLWKALVTLDEQPGGMGFSVSLHRTLLRSTLSEGNTVSR